MNARHTQELVEMQAAADVEPQVDIDQLGFVRRAGAAHTKPVTFGDRRDRIDAAITFL